MTIEELEFARDLSELVSTTRHELEVPDLTHEETFYPLGFPTSLRTNSVEILSMAREVWSMFDQQFHTELIRVELHIVDGDSEECPPTPSYRLANPYACCIANAENYSISNLDTVTTKIILSRATLRHRKYLEYFFLGSAPLNYIATRFATAIHAGCVALDGRGVLLCGESGAGKSSLSYACARAGWTFVTDDASYLVYGGKDRLVTGDCHRIRFRPSAGELFPELKGLEITPRAAGKPSVEMPTGSLPRMICAPTAQVEFLVFLNRQWSGSPELIPFRKDVARHFMRQSQYMPWEWRAQHYAALERLLTAEIFELRYSNMDWAVRRLEVLAREGC